MHYMLENRIMFMFCNGDVVVVCTYFQLNLVSMLVWVVSDRHVLEPYVSVNPSLYAVMGCFREKCILNLMWSHIFTYPLLRNY
jgi:hypothetical protein